MQCFQSGHKPALQLDSKRVTKPVLERLTVKFAYYHLPTKDGRVSLRKNPSKAHLPQGNPNQQFCGVLAPVHATQKPEYR